jgi:hypothetical protein
MLRTERARGERPRSRRAAEQRDELAPLHSITSSAATSRPDGTVRPSAFAVLRLMIVSNLVAACTGRSAGLSALGGGPPRLHPLRHHRWIEELAARPGRSSVILQIRLGC